MVALLHALASESRNPHRGWIMLVVQVAVGVIDVGITVNRLQSLPEQGCPPTTALPKARRSFRAAHRPNFNGLIGQPPFGKGAL